LLLRCLLTEKTFFQKKRKKESCLTDGVANHSKLQRNKRKPSAVAARHVALSLCCGGRGLWRTIWMFKSGAMCKPSKLLYFLFRLDSDNII